MFGRRGFEGHTEGSEGFSPLQSEHDQTYTDYIQLIIQQTRREERDRNLQRAARQRFAESVTDTGFSLAEVRAYAESNRMTVANARDSLLSMPVEDRNKEMENFSRRRQLRGEIELLVPDDWGHEEESAWPRQRQNHETQQPADEPMYRSTDWMPSSVPESSDYLRAVVVSASPEYGRGDMSSQRYLPAEYHEVPAPQEYTGEEVSLPYRYERSENSEAIQPTGGNTDPQAELMRLRIEQMRQQLVPSTYSAREALPPYRYEQSENSEVAQQTGRRRDPLAELMRLRIEQMRRLG
jgi:hypothetical protein